jgi:excisionase family DNA binding protein
MSQQGSKPLPATSEQLDRALHVAHRPREIASPYLTAKECVAYLRLPSLQALYRLITDHQLPYGRRGRIYLFDTRTLDRWIEMGGRVEQVSASAFGKRAGR